MMRSLFAITMVTAAMAGPAILVRAEDKPRGVQIPAQKPVVNSLTSHGCFNAQGSLSDPGGYLASKVTRGFCQNEGCPKGSLVMATKGDQCFCGDEYPPQAKLVDDSFCSFECPGYPFDEACGGLDTGSGSYFSVYNRGVQVEVKYAQEAASSSGSTSAPTSSSSAPSDENKSGEKKSSTNVGGIAAGAVVAVVAVGAIVGGGFFYMRRKRNKEIEEEHRRNAAVSAFVGGKPPSSSGGLSITDSRLDPVMAQRRLSDGSIADNQDYSRKILRVTNA